MKLFALDSILILSARWEQLDEDDVSELDVVGFKDGGLDVKGFNHDNWDDDGAQAT
jgi:hypothetical protein